LRPYRVAAYVTYFAFTLTFIGAVAVSVGTDLYGHPHVGGEASRDTSAAGCTNELEGLKGDLDQRFAIPMGPHAPRNWDGYEADWDRFTRGFEDRLRQVENRCVTPAAGRAPSEPVAAMTLAVDRMELLRQHLARCGMEGEREREQLAEALSELQTAVHPK
jgi:hypothetical protein